MSHTKGPWWTDDDGCVASGSGDSYVTVADCRVAGTVALEQDANARLIAASPTMYEALKRIAEGMADDRAYRDAARAALLEAEGKGRVSPNA